jgi:hypothetical protein
MMKRTRIVILLAAAISLSQLACSSGNQTNAPANVAPERPAANMNAPASAGGPPNQSTAPPSTNNNSSNDNPFSELVMLYSQMFTARMKGDKAKVDGLLAPDYKETTGDGKTLNKAQVLASVTQDMKKPFGLDNLKSTMNGDTATVTGRASITEEGGHAENWQFSTTFKKEQGKWLATSTTITDYRKT